MVTSFSYGFAPINSHWPPRGMGALAVLIGSVLSVYQKCPVTRSEPLRTGVVKASELSTSSLMTHDSHG